MPHDDSTARLQPMATNRRPNSQKKTLVNTYPQCTVGANEGVTNIISSVEIIPSLDEVLPKRGRK